MKWISLSLLFLFASPYLYGASASPTPAPITPREEYVGTPLSTTDAQREAKDRARFPNFMKFLDSVNVSGHMAAIDPRNAVHTKAAYAYDAPDEVWDRFFQSAAADKITCLRAFALLAHEVKKRGMVVFGPGFVFEKAAERNKVDMGLAIPASHIGASLWTPNPEHPDPEFQVHVRMFYTEAFIHHFPDHILPANLKIGYGTEKTYWLRGQEYTQPTIDADIYYGPTKGVGFRNVKGIGGQKRGILGFLQKVLFFLPDAVDSMVIDETKNRLVTEALVNTVVEEFETNPVYSVKVNQENSENR